MILQWKSSGTHGQLVGKEGFEAESKIAVYHLVNVLLKKHLVFTMTKNGHLGHHAPIFVELGQEVGFGIAKVTQLAKRSVSKKDAATLISAIFDVIIHKLVMVIAMTGSICPWKIVLLTTEIAVAPMSTPCFAPPAFAWEKLEN